MATDAPIAYDEEALRYKGPDKDALTPIFEDLEFKTMLARAFTITAGSSAPEPVVQTSSEGSQLSMFGSPAAEAAMPRRSEASAKYKIVSNDQERKELLEALKLKREFAIDVTTDDAEHFDFKVTSLAVSADPGEAWVVGVNGDALRDFEQVLGDPRITKVGHNIKESIRALKKI